MPKADFIDKHKKFNDTIIKETKSIIETEQNVLENFLTNIIKKSSNLNLISLSLKKYKKNYLKNDSDNLKRNTKTILEISRKFAKEKI